VVVPAERGPRLGVVSAAAVAFERLPELSDAAPPRSPSAGETMHATDDGRLAVGATSDET
jgi:hypothetical protein